MSRSLLLGLIGEHVLGSITPPLLERTAAAEGIPCVDRPLDPTQMPRLGTNWAQIVRLAAEYGYDGVNVTHPAKQAVMPALDALSPDAEALGAVNTIRFVDGRAIGHNTDHSGFALGLQHTLPAADLREVVLLGAGGAGSAIGYALLTLGASLVRILDVDAVRTQALADRLGAAFGTERVVAGHPDEAAALLPGATGLVNATPIGMLGSQPRTPIETGLLHPGLWVADAVYRPLETPLLAAARAIGCATVDGGKMAVGQAAGAFELFTGRTPDLERMRTDFIALTQPIAASV